MWCVCDLSVPEHTYVLVLIIILQTRCQIESQVPGCIYLKSLLALFFITNSSIYTSYTYIHSTRLFAQSKIAVKSVLKLRTIFHMELLGEAPQLVFFCIVSCSCTWKRGEWVESAEMFKSWPQQYIYYMYCIAMVVHFYNILGTVWWGKN